MTQDRWIGRAVLAFALALFSTPAFAQGASATSSLSGVVTDKTEASYPAPASWQETARPERREKCRLISLIPPRRLGDSSVL